MERLSRILPRKLVEMNKVDKYFEGEKVRCHPDLALEDLGAEKIFVGEVLAVSK